MDMYGFWRSQATFRLRVALGLKGLTYREIPVDIDHGGQDDPGFRRINPMGGVPALVVDGTPLTQSSAILEYLEECHPEPPLLPADAMGRARVRALAAIAISDSHPLIVPRVRRYLAENAGFDADQWRLWLIHWFSAGLDGFEARLAGDPATGRFCHGEAPTFADICLAGVCAGANTFGIVVPAIPTVDRIVARCMALPSFEQARAQNQADFPG